MRVAPGRPDDGFDRSLWAALTPPPAATPPLVGEVAADVAVVGAGLLGLSLALHLGAGGVKTVLVEAEQPGFGASGRNTGFVVPSFAGGHDPLSVAALLGPEAGERLARFVGGSGQSVFDAIARFGLACAAEQTGWLQPALTPAHLQLLEARVRAWQALGQPVELIGRAETARLTGCPRYRGALLDRSGGQLNPLAYARELARAAMAQGAALHGGSPVTGMTRAEGRWRLTTPQGAVTAERVFCTTNALGGALMPEVRRSLIAVRPYQVATEPLDAATRARLLPERQPVSDLHRHTFAYRLSPDHRLVTGGIAVLNDPGATDRMAEYFLRRLGRYLPDLPRLTAAFAWSGVIATTPAFLPVLWSPAQQLYAPIGCNGRGVALTTALGRALADWVVHDDPARLPLAVSPPCPHAFHAALALGPSVWLAWNRLQDGRDDRTSASLP